MPKQTFKDPAKFARRLRFLAKEKEVEDYELESRRMTWEEREEECADENEGREEEL